MTELTFVNRGGAERGLQLEVRPGGVGAGLPFVLRGCGGCQIELSPRDLEWLRAVTPRAIVAAQKIGRC